MCFCRPDIRRQKSASAFLKGQHMILHNHHAHFTRTHGGGSAKSETIVEGGTGGRQRHGSKNGKDFMDLIAQWNERRDAGESPSAQTGAVPPGFELFEVIQNMIITGLTLPER